VQIWKGQEIKGYTPVTPVPDTDRMLGGDGAISARAA
jgi:hypothetical protein